MIPTVEFCGGSLDMIVNEPLSYGEEDLRGPESYRRLFLEYEPEH